MASSRVVSRAARALKTMETVVASGARCPCHGAVGCPTLVQEALRHSSSGLANTDYAFEMAMSSVRFGRGVTREVGYDFANMKAKHVLVVTDATIAKLTPYTAAIESLELAKVKYTTYDTVRVEPTDASMKELIAFAKAGDYDSFLAIGGGSVIDTAKAANLYACHPDADFLDFVNAPLGKGLPVMKALKPFIAVPTTSGTGSETTGVAIFDYESKHAKTGIANRALRPTLGIVDPLNMMTMPKEVTVASGFDVLCHALESFTALPYHQRSPRPADPSLRPAYQGSNPVSDVWARYALNACERYFIRAVENPEDLEAREAMALASTAAGVGFGNAGVHLPHGMSYPISGLNKSYKHPGYEVDHCIVPHGVSVIMSAPAVFRFTAPTNPERHLEAAKLLGADTTFSSPESAGDILADRILWYMDRCGIPDGLSALGYSMSDIEALVAGTLPQKRVTDLAPQAPAEEDLAAMFEDTLHVYK